MFILRTYEILLQMKEFDVEFQEQIHSFIFKKNIFPGSIRITGRPINRRTDNRRLTVLRTTLE